MSLTGICGNCILRQHRTIPALRLKHRSGSCGTASALPKCSIMSGCGTRIVLRGQKPLALCDRCPCFGSLFPPLAALTFAASSIICAFGLASAAPRLPYRHLELCGIVLKMCDGPCRISLSEIRQSPCPSPKNKKAPFPIGNEALTQNEQFFANSAKIFFTAPRGSRKGPDAPGAGFPSFCAG